MAVTRRNIVDVSLLVLVNAMWAAQYAAYKVATEKMGPVTVSAWSFLIAALVLLPFLLWEQCRHSSSGHPDNPHTVSAADRSLLNRRNALGFLIVGVLGLIPASVFLAWGIERSTASNASLIYLTVPIITALLASLILGEKMTPVRWASLALSLFGVIILSDFDWRHLELSNSKFLFGNFLVLLACASSSFYNVYSKDLLKRFRPLEVLIYGYLLAFVVSLALVAWVEPFSFAAVAGYGASVWLALLVLASLSWGLAMVLWMFLLKRLDVSQVSVSIYLLPFLGILIASITLHEKVTPLMLIGGLITLGGTALTTSTEASG